MGKRWMAALALGGALLVAGQTVAPLAGDAAWAQGFDESADAVQGELAAPEISHESGRYVGAQTVELTAAAGAEIRYTLDGTMPTADSPLVEGPIRLEQSANLTAVAFSGTVASEPAMRGILIKTDEVPQSQFAVMSDIHLSSDSPDLVTKWQQYFDTLSRIVPDPDAIISNGDQINDNYYDSAADHRFPRAMLEENMARTGMDDTDVFMTFGNHDDLVTRMAAEYPEEWFPGTSGYYEAEIGGFPAFIVNTEAWNSRQASWLYERLSALTEDPETQDQPIFVFGHRPLPDTVWDGAQASNGGLRGNLEDFPQVVYFSGHSHLNITDERSIHQESFTSVNEGSMSYEEIDSKFQIFGEGLAKEHTVPIAQSLVVEVYGDRIEIDRVNYAADHGRTYDEEGAWSFQKNPPFRSSGTLAGPTWTIARGSTPAETLAGFTYTSANRNASAPEWGDAEPVVRETANGPVLQLPQASDDQFVDDYALTLRDVETDEVVEFVPSGSTVYADYLVAPRPAILEVPLAVRDGNAPGGEVRGVLETGRTYEATLIAYDAYRNASEPRSFTFEAGALDRSALDEAASDAAELADLVERVLGESEPALDEDYGFFIAETEAALAGVADLRAGIAAADGAADGAADSGGSGEGGAGADAPQLTTQDEVDALTASLVSGAADLRALIAEVDRSALRDLIEETRTVLDAAGDAAASGTELDDALTEAERVAATLNQSQETIDGATAALQAALDTFRESGGGTDGEDSGDSGGDGSGGDGSGGSGAGGSGAGGPGAGNGGSGAGDAAANTKHGGALAATGAPAWVRSAALGALIVAVGALFAVAGATRRRG